jgi:hypothetical protein
MKNKRLISGLLLIFLLASLIAYSGLEYYNHDPDIEHIAKNFEKYNNTAITFDGVIEKINTTTSQITVSIPATSYLINVKINNFTSEIKKGNLIEVLGILNGKYNVYAQKILVTETWKSDLIIIRSLPAIPFALYLFFRTWKFNKKKLRFERRQQNA